MAAVSTTSIARLQDDLIQRSEAVQQALHSQTASIRVPKAKTTSALIDEEKERGALLATIEDLRHKFDVLQRKEQTWDEVVDPHTGNVYFKDRATGASAGKYLNTVPGSTSYGYASVGIALKRLVTARDGDGPIVVARVLESSSAHGHVLPFDRLVAINREDVTGLKMSVVHALINGHSGSKVLLTFRRPPAEFRGARFWESPLTVNSAAVFSSSDHSARMAVEQLEVECVRSNAVPLSEELEADPSLDAPPTPTLSAGPRAPASAPPGETPAAWIKTLRQSAPLSSPRGKWGAPGAGATAPMASVDAAQGQLQEQIRTCAAHGSPGARPASTGATALAPLSMAPPSAVSPSPLSSAAPRSPADAGAAGAAGEPEQGDDGGSLGHVEVRVLQASNLPHAAWQQCYLALFLGHAMDESLSAAAGGATLGQVEQTGPGTPGAQVQRTQFHHTSQLPVHSFADALRVQVRRRAADGSDTSLGEVTFPRCAEFVAERGAQRGWYALQDPDVTGRSPRRLVSVSISFVPAARRAADALALGEHGGLHALPLHPEHLAPLESLTEFIDADREGEAALVMRFDAFKDRLPPPKQGQAFRAFSAALQLKLRAVRGEEAAAAARADMAVLDRRLAAHDEQLHERDMELVRMRAEESSVLRSAAVADGESQKLAVMYEREARLRRAAEQEAVELRRQLRAAKDAERASLRHKVEAEGEAERLRTELRHNPFESALGKLIEQWARYKEAMAAANARLEDQLAEHDRALQGAVRVFDDLRGRFRAVEDASRGALRAFLEDPAVRIEGETHLRLREYLKELRTNSELFREHVAETRALRERVAARLLAAEPRPPQLRALRQGQGGGEVQVLEVAPVPEIEKDLVTTRELLEQKMVDLMLTTEALRGAMATHARAEEMVEHCRARRPELEQHMEGLELEFQSHMALAGEANEGLVMSHQDMLASVMDFAGAYNRAVETQDKRIGNLVQKLGETRWVKQREDILASGKGAGTPGAQAGWPAARDAGALGEEPAGQVVAEQEVGPVGSDSGALAAPEAADEGGAREAVGADEAIGEGWERVGESEVDTDSGGEGGQR